MRKTSGIRGSGIFPTYHKSNGTNEAQEMNETRGLMRAPRVDPGPKVKVNLFRCHLHTYTRVRAHSVQSCTLSVRPRPNAKWLLTKRCYPDIAGYLHFEGFSKPGRIGGPANHSTR